ncbi:MAG: hypothetical protein OXD50_09360 [Chloroflexi bacterium]|nr:hypothetical protein [Chloroflexota bacterium]
MNGRFILIAGSASKDCSPDTLDLAIGFVQSFTREILDRGGGVVVLAGDEEGTKDDRGTPHIFDWVVLREVERYAERTTKPPRIYVRIVMSDTAEERKIEDANLQVLRNLVQRNVANLQYIQSHLFTGGEYRNRQVEISDAMLAIGGGKGTYSTAEEMIGREKPVFPVDLPLGALSDDGNGAVLLHQEMASDPESFFPFTYDDAIHKLSLTKLSRGINEADGAARVAVEMFESEFDAHPRDGLRARTTSRLRALAVVAPLFSAMSLILKGFEFFRSDS